MGSRTVEHDVLAGATQLILFLRIAITSLFFSVCSVGHADIVSWIVDADGEWTTSTNWSSNPLLPGITDDVVIDREGAYAISLTSGTQTIKSLTSSESIQLQGGSLDIGSNSTISGAFSIQSSTSSLIGAGNLSLSGPVTWTGGSMAGTGKTILESTAVTTISGNPTLSRTLENSGVINSSNITLTSGTIENLASGQFNLSGGEILESNFANQFNNYGTLSISQTASQPRGMRVPFNNKSSGVTNILSGIVKTAGGGTNSGVINVSPGVNFQIISSFTQLSGSSIRGTGTVTIDNPLSFPVLDFSGSFEATGLLDIQSPVAFNADQDFHGPVAISTGSFASGKLQGSGNVKFSNSLSWDGPMSGTGKSTIAANATTSIGSSASLSRVLDNYGIVSYASPFQSSLSFNNGTFNNFGTFQFVSNNSISRSGTLNAFNNYGTFNKTGASSPSVSAIAVYFNNTSTGTINLSSGTLDFTAGAINDGVINIAPTAVLSANTLTNNGTINFGGISDSFTFRSLSSTIVNSATGIMNILGDSWNTSGTGTNFGTVNVAAGGGFVSGYSHALGSSIKGAGRFAAGAASTINFSGSLEVTGHIAIFSPIAFHTSQNIRSEVLIGATLSGAGDITFHGLVDWSSGSMTGGSKTTIASTSNVSIDLTTATISRTFENNGTINLVGGKLTFSNGTFDNYGTFNCAGPGPFGTKSVEIINGSGTNKLNNYGTMNITSMPIGIVTANRNSGTMNLSTIQYNFRDGSSNEGILNLKNSAKMTVNNTAPYLNDGTISIGPSSVLTLNAVTHSPGLGIFKVDVNGSMLTNHIRADQLELKGLAAVRQNGGIGGASKVEFLSMDTGSKLNLKDNDLVIGTGSVDAIRTQIKLGKTSNAPAGITSDVADFGVKNGFGYAAGSDLRLSPSLDGFITGQSYDEDSVLVKYTLFGDADLDGDTDLNDLGLWASSFTGELQNGSPTTYWTSGDFDYDGDTDLNDLGLWSSTFTGDFSGGTGSMIVIAPAASDDAIEILNEMGIQVIPEPNVFLTTCLCISTIAIALKKRNRATSRNRLQVACVTAHM